MPGPDESPATDDDGGMAEFEVDIEPDREALAKLGISEPDFEVAVRAALDLYERRLNRCGADDEVPLIEDVVIEIRGIRYALTDLAAVRYGEF